MLLRDIFPKNDDGEKILPYGVKHISKSGEEVLSPAIIDDDWFSQVFADFAEKEVPLSENDYQVLLEKSTDIWKLNWQEFRKQGLI